jgi:hypothetical protein
MIRYSQIGPKSIKERNSGEISTLGAVALLIIALAALSGCATAPQAGSSLATEETRDPSPQGVDNRPVQGSPGAGPETPAEQPSAPGVRAEEGQVKEGPDGNGGKTESTPEERWGVKVLGVRRTANAYMLDFRFRVTDPAKATPLLARTAKPFLVDEATGTTLGVPSAPRVGSLRAKGNPEANRSYFILFGNSRGLVKKGSKVTVGIDDFKVEGLEVE